MLDIPLGTSAQLQKTAQKSACCTSRTQEDSACCTSLSGHRRTAEDGTSSGERRHRPLLSTWGLRLTHITIAVAILAEARDLSTMHATHKQESLRFKGATDLSNMYASTWICCMKSTTQPFHATRAYVRIHRIVEIPIIFDNLGTFFPFSVTCITHSAMNSELILSAQLHILTDQVLLPVEF